METRALDGVRVIDLSQLEAGPVCTLTPAQMGAEVIKVERSKYGEQSRMGARSLHVTQGPGAYTIHFALLNPNKKSAALNLKTEKGREILRGLIKIGTVVKVKLHVLVSPLHMSDSPFEIAPSPTLGQHTDEAYMHLLSMTEAEISALREEGVI